MVAASGKVALCEHIIFQHFGAAVGLVASILLARGRLSYETLLRLVPRTLNQRTVQASILVLVQHNCLYHVLDEEEGLEYFEMNVPEILERRKIGTYLALTREYWDKTAAEVVNAVISDGKIRLSSLVEDLTSGPSTSSKSANALRYRTVVKAVYDLLVAEILRPVSRTDQTSASDQDLQFEKQLMRKLNGPAAAKELREINRQVVERRIELDSQTPDWGQDTDAYADLLAEMEEDARDDGAAAWQDADERSNVNDSKKRKGGVAARHDFAKSKKLSLPFDGTKYVRVMYAPFHVRTRNELLVRAVRAQRGGAAAVLVQGMLSETLKLQKSLHQETTDHISSARLVEPANRRSPSRKTIPLPGTGVTQTNGHYGDVHEQHAYYTLFPGAPIPATLGLEPTGRWHLEAKEPHDLVNEMLHLLHSTADSRPKLEALSDQHKRFAIAPDELRANSWLHCSDTAAAQHDYPHVLNSRVSWAVDFAMAHDTLKLGLVETYVRKRFGKEALRVWRIVNDKGKLEEKHIAKTAMLPTKDVRELVVALSSAGFLRQQEVPRTADRNPSRTFFLWFVSREGCYQLLLAQLYETLVNLLVRQEEELLRNRALLRRNERRDVRENRGLLDKGDQEELKLLDWKIESLRVSMERVDKDLFILETLPTLPR